MCCVVFFALFFFSIVAAVEVYGKSVSLTCLFRDFFVLYFSNARSLLAHDSASVFWKPHFFIT